MKVLLIVLLIMNICHISSQKITQVQSTNQYIYGVRWFLAEAFRHSSHKNSSDNSEADLMAMFNTYERSSLFDKFKIRIDSEQFSCFINEVSVRITDSFHEDFNNQSSKIGSTFTTYIYSCPISFNESQYLEKHDSFIYEIYAANGDQIVKMFQASLRSPLSKNVDLKAIVVGDWGKITAFSEQYQKLVPIDKCLAEKIKAQKINLMIILGDLGYDLQGKTYIDFLIYLQPYSSALPILFTPGNHQTCKHPNIFPLVIQTFYSPYWKLFYGYFQMAFFGKHLIFGYNPDSLFYHSLFESTFKQLYGEHINLLQAQLTPEIIQQISQGYQTVAISHYPMFCSEQTQFFNCSFVREKQQAHLKFLKRLKTKMIFSGHLHYYERSKPICDLEGKSLLENVRSSLQQDIYSSKQCTIFVMDGAAGNNYYVQTEQTTPLKSFSKISASNTGFGILSLFSNEESEFSADFQHISTVNNCRKVDQFSLLNESRNFKPKAAKWSNITFEIIALLLITIVILLIVYTLLKQRAKNRQQQRLGSVSSIGELTEIQNSGR